MANKLLKPKRGRVENLPKLAVEDGSLIFAYDTKSPTSTVLVDVGETRYELSAATAKKADDSNALGGSSLQNIVDKIDNTTSNGTVFTGLDTTTNNKVKLTRANGITVEKTVNNVSNASTADYAKVSNKIGTGIVGSSTKPVYINAGTPTAINSIPSTFVTAQQINGINLDTLRTPGRYFANGSNANTGKPTGVDAFALEILQSAGGWYTQICYASNNQEKQFVRYYNSGTSSWSDWVEQNRLNTKTQSGYAPAPDAANKVYRTDANGNPGWGTLNDSSIGKLASTVTFGDGNGAMIDQNGATYRQRINIFDNATANDAVFSFQQSTDVGKTYKDLFAINDDGTVVAGTFQGALKGTADNSNALGGSSLSQVLASAGGGNAFTGLETTTNNKIKLTRANGKTVEKTINNVSNASSASFASTAILASTASNASTAIYLGRNPIARPTNLNIGITGAGGIRTFVANGNITNKAPFDAHIIHLDWDTTGGWDAQIAVEASKNGHMAVRGMGGSVWGSWNTVLDSANYTSYAADRTAFSEASISGRDIILTRANGGTVKITTQDSDVTYPVHEGAYDASFASSFRSESFGTAASGWHLAAVRTDVANVSYAPQYGSGIAWARKDTHGYLYVDYSEANAYIGGGDANKLNWQKQLAFLDSTVANATSAENASHLGGKPSSDYALKAELSGDINALSAKRLPSYQSVSVANSFFYRYGTAGNTSDGGAWTGFPSATLYSEASTANGFGSALFQKKVGVLHLASGSSAHDLVFQAGGTNGGIAYVATGRNPAYILDTLNYKDKAYTFNKLTASSTFTATSGVVIDGGSY